MHTLVCDRCYCDTAPYFRAVLQRRAIHAALLRQALMGDGMGKALRWTEQQYHEHLRKTQAPTPRESKKQRELPQAKVADSRTITFELPLTPMRNALDRMHFRVKRRLLGELGDAFLSQYRPLYGELPFPRARVEIVRMSSIEPDEDGLYGSVKPILDALQPRSDRHPYGSGVITNDNPSCIELHVRWERAAPKRGRVVVLVTPIA